MSESHKGQIAWNKGKTKIYSEETLKKMKEYLKYKEKYKCPYCNNYYYKVHFNRWHGEKCKDKVNLI